MTRVISGFAGSRELKVPKNGTRPTSDRVREAVFSALESQGVIEGASVLDLYAGSGALGLEALSRGANHVDLVEKNPQASAIAGANSALVKSAGGHHSGTVQVHSHAVMNFLQGGTGIWDLVFIDPPYEAPNDEVTSVLEQLREHTEVGAVIVVERSTRSPELEIPEGFIQNKIKKYGETSIIWLTRS